jgi:hypothetical protein
MAQEDLGNSQLFQPEHLQQMAAGITIHEPKVDFHHSIRKVYKYSKFQYGKHSSNSITGQR